MRPSHFLALILILSVGLLAYRFWSDRRVPEEAEEEDPFPIWRFSDIGKKSGDRVVREIGFLGKCPEEYRDDVEVCEDGVYDHIRFGEAEGDIARLFEPDEVVLPAVEYTLVIEYPVAEPVERVLAPKDSRGFTRAEIAREIARVYRSLYEEEESTSKLKVIPPGERGPVLNRSRTDGVHGIWGHDLDDLALDTIQVFDRGGRKYLTLSVDS